MGTRAVSHDSIFIPDGQAEDGQETPATSQDHNVGKVKSLQQQLGKNIRFGQPPPANVPIKRMQDLGAATEEMEETQNDSMDSLGEHDVGVLSSGNMITGSPSSHGTRNAPQPEHKTEEKVTPVKSYRTKRPSGTIESINLDAVPRSAACLDNSAAKHKLSVKPKNQRVSKKHRGMSQDCYNIEDIEHETGLSVRRSLNKAMYHSMDISRQDIIVSNYFERKALGLPIPEQGKKDWEEKHEEPVTSKSDVSRQTDKEKMLDVDKRRTEEEQKRQEIIKNIELERLQHKMREQKENEMKEQRRREEEKKRRAEHILKELEEQRKQDEQKQRELEEQKRLKLAEEQKTRELEQKKAQQLAEEQKRKETEAQQKALQEAVEQKRLEAEKQKAEEEKKKRELEEQRALQEEQNKHKLEEQRILMMAEEQRERELEQQKALQIAEEERKREEEQQQAIQIAEEQRKHELEQQKALKIAEEQRKCEQEHQKALQTALEQRKYEMEHQKALQLEEEHKRHELQRSLLEEEKRHDLEEQSTDKAAEEQKGLEVEVEEKKLVHEEPLQKGNAINEGVKKNAVEAGHSSPERSIIEKPQPEKLKAEEASKENDVASKQRQSNEELRWQELDQRQRPFTFKVTSGEKQIIFEKVHLSPVTGVKEQPTCADTPSPKETKANSSHALPSSQCIPHTAILVTGAQLCGTAVNLNQIQDTACKTLLGLTEERKLDIAETKNERDSGDPKYISCKTKYTSESLENQSVMAEWASIRSKIFSKTENAAMTEKNKSDPPASSDEWTAKGKGESHNILRKTVSANAKFSITPAWQKFPETAKNVAFSTETSIIQTNREHIETALPDRAAQGRSTERAMSVQEVVANKRQVTIEDGAEGCIFSKDLPSFLVPNPPPSPRRGHLEGQTSLTAHMVNSIRKTEKLIQTTEEKMAPFGIKLRRTHYSLRFHSDPQNDQKRKKRYSAGDSFEGIPTPFTAGDETEIRTLPLKECSVSPTKLKKDSTCKVLLDSSNNASENVHSTLISPVIPDTSPNLSSPNKDRIAPKSPVIHKPSLAPKPSSPTPPSSPLYKLSKTDVNDPHDEKWDKTETGHVTNEVKASVALPPSKHSESIECDKTDKANLPSIPWREKPEKRPEKTGRDRPVLQSRHSLDGTRLMEKVESAQPLWITLALQKQKGFREQQASREERRQAREAKQADKLAKDIACNVQTGEYRSRSGSLQKPQEEKKCETVVTRLQRREQLQKSNTLPTSVTVEITETVPVTHAKDLPKRFSTPDATTVSSEPAWLALAKRKSKAWSDCPQIIK
ncbi:capping protein-inhibiting regulator of actin dynamics isoform X2 [Hyla sarda]|nr:capping protein-inhibiting regulator of actin dynamics isoform X2 [Hyla sarda]XP_056414371.1 capping protein-inhibiting regulator of actin dynamics isoform X2 [Hyla sarda]XP_056414378.1 capping protein-inhibiting regulator of actin dynamics isoform X2 [Hyla sarda]